MSQAQCRRACRRHASRRLMQSGRSRRPQPRSRRLRLRPLRPAQYARAGRRSTSTRHRPEPAQAGPAPPPSSAGPRPTEAGRPGSPAQSLRSAGVPVRIRRALPRREAGRCRRVAMLASQRCRAVAGVPSALRGGGGEGGAPPEAGSGTAATRSGTEAPAAAPPPAAVAPLGPIPPMMPRQAIEILSFCGQERGALCGNVPPGGGRIIVCLAENAPRLSPPCYGAIARAIR